MKALLSVKDGIKGFETELLKIIIQRLTMRKNGVFLLSKNSLNKSVKRRKNDIIIYEYDELLEFDNKNS